MYLSAHIFYIGIRFQFLLVSLTHNFSDDEIFNALCFYFEDDIDLSINQEDLKEIGEKIKDGYGNGVKIEKIIDEIIDDKH